MRTLVVEGFGERSRARVSELATPDLATPEIETAALP